MGFLSGCGGSTKPPISDCSYERRRDLHYPAGGEPNAPTAQEQQEGICDERGESTYEKSDSAQFKALTLHRTANRAMAPGPLSRCAMAEILEISRTLGREISVIVEASTGQFKIGWGNAGTSPPEDVTKTLSFFHTHPNATKQSLPLATHSPVDLTAALVFAAAQGRDAISTLVGTTCGGPMETSTVAVSGNVIYATNAQEKDWLAHLLNSTAFAPYKQLMTEAGLRTAYRVEINAEKVRAIVAAVAARYQISSEAENTILTAIRRGPPSHPRQ